MDAPTEAPDAEGARGAPAFASPSPMQLATWRSFGFEHASAAGAVLDSTGCIVATNAAWRLFALLNGGDERSTGEGANYLETCAPSAATGCEIALAVLAGLGDILTSQRTSFDIEYRCPSPEHDRWFLLQATSANVTGGSGIVVFHLDITARKTLETGLADRPHRDLLTGLGNGTAARDALGPLLRGAGIPVSLLAFDLGEFESVSDAIGHHASREVVVHISHRARHIVGGVGEVYRIGDDEFVVLCAGAPPAEVHRLAAVVHAQLAVPIQIGTGAVTVGARTGVATSGDHASADGLLAEAHARKARCQRRHQWSTEVVDSRVAPAGTSTQAGPGAAPATSSPRSAAPEPLSRAEAQLRALQAATDAVLPHASDLVVFFDEEGTITWASPASQRLFGRTTADLIGQKGSAFVHPDDRERVFADFSTIPRWGDSVRTEFRLVGVGTEVRWVEEVATNLLEDPDVGAVVGHIRDITDRKAAEEEVRFQARLLAAVGQAIVAQDMDGTVLYWNRAAEDLYGWSSSEAIGRRTRELVPPSPGWEERTAEVRRLLAEGIAWSGELSVTARAGQQVPVGATATPVLGADGTASATIIVAKDISARLAQSAQAEQDRQRLADAQALAGLGSFEIDLVARTTTNSKELQRITGRAVDVGGIDLASVHPDDRDAVRTTFDLLVSGASETVEITHRILRPDGDIRWVVSNANRSRSAPHLITGTTLDITERHLAEMALAHQANHDPLTGLANRRLLVHRIEASLERNAVTGRRTALLFIDLDDFKAVNDRFGHSGGDQILRAVGDVIDRAITPGDTVARLGGDEFVVCCEGVADIDGALVVVERIRGALSAPLEFRSEVLSVAASIGVVLSQPASRAEALLRDADAAMYVAKQDRSHVEVFSDALRDRADHNRRLVDELGLAIAGGQIHTWFQPEVELHSGGLVGFEALARWVHPERGVIGPGEFIGLAEASGLISELGRRVLREACAELARWIDRHPDRHLTVSVNVSPAQMASPDLADDVRSAIGSAGVPPGRVCIEVTEGALMDARAAADVLRRLKEIGVLIAIDDFGTGYSSLSRLKEFPVDYLKIDRSFVAGLGREPEDELIVAAVANLAHSMGIGVIAEGIETGEQLSMLDEMSCELGQGFFWSRPMPAAEALAYTTGAGARSSAGVAVPGGAARQAHASPDRRDRPSVSDSVALLVHELASPLTISLGYSTLLREAIDVSDRSADDGTEAVEAIVRANQDMASIMQLLADVRPLEEGTLALDRTQVDLGELLAEVIDEFRTASGAPVLSASAPTLVLVDPVRVRQIFRNLLTNAQKWQTSETRVQVAADEVRNLVMVSVIDDGPGVRAERVGDLFRRFARFDRSQTGSGLGLYLSRALARAHGGDVRYRRYEAGGSEFVVELPLVPRLASAAEALTD